ncbi:MAG: hypothetical protein M3P29_10110 [Acidobacteriota bacterium]|nr:hypothetical protein [Acidobacteriota bacterium]
MNWYLNLFGEGNVVRERSFTRWNDFREKTRKDARVKELESRENKKKNQEPEQAPE